MLTRCEAIDQLVREDARFQLEERKVRGVPLRVYRSAAPSLRSVLESTASWGERDFLVYEEQRWTYAQHFDVVARLADSWANRGIRKGDRVAIAMRNYPEWAMAFWAAQALGAVTVPLNAWWRLPELAYALQDCRPKVLVVDGERLEVLSSALADLPVGHVVAVRADYAVRHPVVRWDDEVEAGCRGSKLPPVTIGPDDDATIIYTSGTTGHPKGAIATQRNHTTNLRNSELSGAANINAVGLAQPDPHPSEGAQAVMLQTFPFFHVGGLTGLYVAAAMGARLCLMYKWDTTRAADLIEAERVSATSMVPTLLRRLLEEARDSGRAFATLTAISSGGAPVPPDLIRQLGDQFAGRISPGNGYGLTETTSAVVVNSGNEYFAHPDSVGRPVPVVDIRVVDPLSTRDQPSGVIGELWFRGPTIVRGYWNKPEDTAAAFRDGWFRTGDLGRVDTDGLVYVVDRLKDVVIRAGENVYCAEIEAALFEHPAVADAAVVGVPHAVLGEEVVALVELRPGASVHAADLQDHAAQRLAHFKVPSRVVFLEEPLPRTATGKVLKRELRQGLVNAPLTKEVGRG